MDFKPSWPEGWTELDKLEFHEEVLYRIEKLPKQVRPWVARWEAFLRLDLGQTKEEVAAQLDKSRMWVESVIADIIESKLKGGRPLRHDIRVTNQIKDFKKYGPSSQNLVRSITNRTPPNGKKWRSADLNDIGLRIQEDGLYRELSPIEAWNLIRLSKKPDLKPEDFLGREYRLLLKHLKPFGELFGPNEKPLKPSELAAKGFLTKKRLS